MIDFIYQQIAKETILYNIYLVYKLLRKWNVIWREKIMYSYISFYV